MMAHKSLLSVGLLAAAGLACSLVTGSPGQPTQTHSLSVTVIPTVQPAQPTAAAPTQIPTVLPTATAASTPAATSSPSPVPTAAAPAPAELLPKGVVVDPQDSIGLAFVNAAGKTITELRTPPNASFPGPGSVHVAGRIPAGVIDVPLAFITYENGGSLVVNRNDQFTSLRSGSTLITLVGAPGEPVAAFSLVADATGSNPSSQLFAGKLDDLAAAEPLLTEPDKDGYVLYPLAVDAPGGDLAGVWYTYQPYGIGDIIFPPNQGLYYFDAQKKSSLTMLPRDVHVQGISPDRHWTALTRGAGSGQFTSPLEVVKNGEPAGMKYPQAAASGQLGAGFAVFSPNGKSLAWTEASGQMPNSLQYRWRVALTAGSAAPLEIDPAALSSLTGGWEIRGGQTAGWLDDQTLLIQVYGDQPEQQALLRVQADGSSPARYAAGRFVGFYYP